MSTSTSFPSRPRHYADPRFADLIGTDIDTITNSLNTSLYLWAVPPKLVVTLVFLYYLLGWSAFVALGAVIVITPVSTLASRRYGSIQGDIMKVGCDEPCSTLVSRWLLRQLQRANASFLVRRRPTSASPSLTSCYPRSAPSRCLLGNPRPRTRSQMLERRSSRESLDEPRSTRASQLLSHDDLFSNGSLLQRHDAPIYGYPSHSHAFDVRVVCLHSEGYPHRLSRLHFRDSLRHAP